MQHFTYRDLAVASDLMQGDVVKRTPQVEAILRDVHPHYFQRADNKFFVVITQDCDLVRRDGKVPASRYLAIAPVRPLTVVLNRYLARYIRKGFPSVPVCSEDDKGRIRNFLERLLNNNEGDYFYLRAEPDNDFPEDCCAFLPLSIALKSHLHYQTLLDARILGLREGFRAKLGWLVGQMYARVGTPDWPHDQLRHEIDDMLDNSAIWIDEGKLKVLQKELAQWQTKNPGTIPTKGLVASLAEQIPRRKERVVQQTIQVLCNKGVLPAADKNRAANLIRNDPLLSALIID